MDDEGSCSDSREGGFARLGGRPASRLVDVEEVLKVPTPHYAATGHEYTHAKGCCIGGMQVAIIILSNSMRDGMQSMATRGLLAMVCLC